MDRWSGEVIGVKFGSFRQYSFHNCMAYQRMELVRRACDCVPFYFPHKEPVRLCNFNDVPCLENIYMPKEDHHDNFGMTFHCFPECEHFDYPLEVAQGDLAHDLQHNGLPFFNDVKLENRSLLNVFFNDLVSTKYRRDVYFNWQNLLAAFGGLLSLMLGFTLISGFDFVLFFAFRMPFDKLFRKATPESSVNAMKNKVNPSKLSVQQKKDTWMTDSLKNEVFLSRYNKKW
nr:unnamed protein product [Amyelois transitella]